MGANLRPSFFSVAGMDIDRSTPLGLWRRNGPDVRRSVATEDPRFVAVEASAERPARSLRGAFIRPRDAESFRRGRTFAAVSEGFGQGNQRCPSTRAGEQNVCSTSLVFSAGVFGRRVPLQADRYRGVGARRSSGILSSWRQNIHRYGSHRNRRTGRVRLQARKRRRLRERSSARDGGSEEDRCSRNDPGNFLSFSRTALTTTPDDKSDRSNPSFGARSLLPPPVRGPSRGHSASPGVLCTRRHRSAKSHLSAGIRYRVRSYLKPSKSAAMGRTAPDETRKESAGTGGRADREQMPPSDGFCASDGRSVQTRETDVRSFPRSVRRP